MEGNTGRDGPINSPPTPPSTFLSNQKQQAPTQPFKTTNISSITLQTNKGFSQCCKQSPLKMVDGGQNGGGAWGVFTNIKPKPRLVQKTL